MSETAATSEVRTAPAGRSGPFGSPPLAAALGLVAVAALAARFAHPAPVWGREAVEVTLAGRPLGDLVGELRQAGGPPLWIVVLHLWRSVAGDGDTAVRILPGLLTLLTLPVVALLGRRLGGRSLGRDLALLLALSPYALAIGSDAGPSAFLVLLAATAALALADALDRPTTRSLALLAATAAALLWTHYWAIPLVGAAVTAVTWRWRRGPADRRAAAGRALAALAAGTAAFLPWLGELWTQLRDAGTPWGDAVRPATLLTSSIMELNGGPSLLVFLTVPLLALGIFGSTQIGTHVELDVRGRADSLGTTTLLATALVLGSAMVLLTRTTFEPAYSAVFFVPTLVLWGFGLGRLRGGARHATLAALAVVCAVGLLGVLGDRRSQSDDVASTVERRAPGGALVLACPDEAGPSVRRALPDRYDVVRFPDLGPADEVDWLGHDARMRTADAAAVATEVRNRAAGRTVFVALSPSARLSGTCNQVVGALGSSTGGRVVLEADSDEYRESLRVIELPA